MRRATALFCAAATGLAVFGAGVLAVQTPAAAQAAKLQPFAMAVRRLTESQYRNIIADVFAPDMTIDARFEPERREEGLQAVGNAQLSVTASGFEQYFALAQSISAQAVEARRRDKVVGCQPADSKAADAACTRAVVQRIGKALFRRPLTEAEVATRLKIAATGTARSGEYYEGLRLALASLLVDPEFLFRVEGAEPDPARAGHYRLNAYAKASRLSFLLWDAGPDAELLQAAESGAIHQDAVLQAQVDRMLASPKLRAGARAFFADMLQFEHFDSLVKDGATYPKYSQKLADSAREQTIRTLIGHLVDENRDYRDVFTSTETWINRPLAAVYKVPYASKQEWTKVNFPESAERNGILTQVTFLSLFSHPAASSPTKRGAKVHEIFLCKPIPEPPADVDFSAVQALDKGTVRTRLIAHMENPGCASCHQVTDPVGLALEQFDGIGARRLTENGAPIDVSAVVRGKPVVGARGVAQVMHDEPAIPACLVRNVYAYGVGRAPEDADDDYLDAQTAAFAKDGYRFKALLANVAASPGFFKVTPPEGLRALPRVVATARRPGSQGGQP